jgi:hypothetical protein
MMSVPVDRRSMFLANGTGQAANGTLGSGNDFFGPP